MRPLPNTAQRELIKQLFEEEYEPGLFRINERLPDTPFLKDEEIRDYREWASCIARAHLLSLWGYMGKEKSMQKESELLIKALLAVLEMPYRGTPLSASHTNQEADSLISQVIRLLVFNDPHFNMPIQRDLNNSARQIVTPILDCFDCLSLDKMWKVSIDAGLIGAEIKETSSGGRALHRSLNRAIPLRTDSGPATPQSVLHALMRRCSEPLGIDFRQEYFAEVLAKRMPRSLVWFTDDYIETMFDLKLIESQMRINPGLSVSVIPRDGSHGQDASFEDVMELLAEERSFAELDNLQRPGRLHLCSNGPRTSCIDGRKLSEELATHVVNADVVVVKGARSYEMLQGLKKRTYFCLSGSCSFTESLTGLDMDLAQGIMLRQDPGVLTYADFRAQSTRRALARSGREYGLARMTATEYAAARRSRQYHAHLRRFNNQVDACNEWLLANAKEVGRTFSEVTLGYASARSGLSGSPQKVSSLVADGRLDASG